MNIDSLLWYKWCTTCEKFLVGAKVNQIRQIDIYNYELSLFSEKGLFYLHIRLQPVPIMWIDSHKTPGNKNPPKHFCMSLRKHLESSTIEKIEQINGDKIISFSFSSIGYQGKISTKKIIFELVPGTGILVLTENNYIIDSTSNAHKERRFLSKKPYTLPPHSDRMNWLLFNSKELFDLFLASPSHLTVEEACYHMFNGFSKKLFCEISYRTKLDSRLMLREMSENDIRTLLQCLAGFKTNLHADSAVYQYEDGTKCFVSAIMLMGTDVLLKKIYKDANCFISEVLANQPLQLPKSNTMIKKVNTMLSHENRKYLKLQLEREELQKQEIYKTFADLLTIYSYLPKPDQSFIVLDNILSNPMEKITIPLEKERTLIENGQVYYKSYQRLKRRSEKIDIFISQAKERIKYLESVLYFLESASVQEIDTLAEELGMINKTINPRSLKKKRPTEKDLNYIEFDGYRIGVGKNNLENDYLTFRIARHSDLWMHAKDTPGSHVIIFKDGNHCFTSGVIEYAASIAAFYSKAKENTNVEVDYTLRKNVKKNHGNSPGMVYYSNYQTISVKPKEVK